MKHLQFVNYPQYLYFVCHESRVGVYYNASLNQRGLIKALDLFYKEMEQHGFDVLTPADEVAFKKALHDMNNAIRREARKYRDTSYEKLTIDNEICRCGKWLFLRQSPLLGERSSVPLIYKTTQEKPKTVLKAKTSPLRVPSDEKDKIKELIDWLHKTHNEGIDIRSALWSAIWNLKRTAEELTFNPELADKVKQEVELLQQLYIKLSLK